MFIYIYIYIYIYKLIMLAYKWFSIISEFLKFLCVSPTSFSCGVNLTFIVCLRGGGLLSFHANFYCRGGGVNVRVGLCPTLAFQGGGQGGPFSNLPVSFLPALFSFLPPLVFFLPPLLRFKVWTFTFRSTKLGPAKIC